MSQFAQVLPWIELASAILLIPSILLQQSGASLGGALGGTDDAIYYTKRGPERFFFGLTIFLASVLVISAILEIALR